MKLSGKTRRRVELAYTIGWTVFACGWAVWGLLLLPEMADDNMNTSAHWIFGFVLPVSLTAIQLLPFIEMRMIRAEIADCPFWPRQYNRAKNKKGKRDIIVIVGIMAFFLLMTVVIDRLENSTNSTQVDSVIDAIIESPIYIRIILVLAVTTTSVFIGRYFGKRRVRVAEEFGSLGVSHNKE